MANLPILVEVGDHSYRNIFLRKSLAVYDYRTGEWFEYVEDDDYLEDGQEVMEVYIGD